MQYRTIGHSGPRISVVGFGGWGIGGATAGATSYGSTDDAVSRRALRRAFELGITFFDTSPAYGDGHSEALIGETLHDVRERVFLATKIGIRSFADGRADFTLASVRRSVEESLARLRTDRIDLLQFHNATAADLAANRDTLDHLERLRERGTIRLLGLSLKRPEDYAAAAALVRADVVQVNLNMLDTRAVEAGLLPPRDPGLVPVIARTPLCFGFLSGHVDGGTVFSDADHRSRWSPAQRRRWTDCARAAMDLVGPPGSHVWSQSALRFCLSFPGVATVIPGIMTEAEADANAAAAALGPLPADAAEAILAFNRINSAFVGP
ncbi:MAG TPA: aldo/keto reductase [Azospirillaceae bacterium]|nr:aldo/keto reductase [Azospirillaceae bacterium]